MTKQYCKLWMRESIELNFIVGENLAYFSFCILALWGMMTTWDYFERKFVTGLKMSSNKSGSRLRFSVGDSIWKCILDLVVKQNPFFLTDRRQELREGF